VQVSTGSAGSPASKLYYYYFLSQAEPQVVSEWFQLTFPGAAQLLKVGSDSHEIN